MPRFETMSGRRPRTEAPGPAIFLIAVLAAAGPAAAAATVSAGTGSPGVAALDLAFRFASAIVSDPKDRARAQEEVVRDYAARGAYAEARAAAERIEGWRRGTALADLAAVLAAAGRVDEAREILARAEQVRAATDGWEGVRIVNHIAAAHAALGDVERAGAMAAPLAANDRQYGGRDAAVIAAALARRGEPGMALERLAALDGAADLEVAWWRTQGYLDVARGAAGEPAWRRRALDAARRSADGLPGWKRAEGLILVAREMREAGRKSAARETLRSAEEIVVALPPTMPTRGLLLAQLARGWAESGRFEDARSRVRDAEESIPATPVIDRPGLYAAAAAAGAAAGDKDAAARLYDKAMTAAEGLRNARPRALAAVDICRVLGQENVELREPVRSRLERLLGALRDPW